MLKIEHTIEAAEPSGTNHEFTMLCSVLLSSARAQVALVKAARKYHDPSCRKCVLCEALAALPDEWREDEK